MPFSREDLEEYPETAEMRFLRADPKVACLVIKAKSIINKCPRPETHNPAFKKLKTTLKAISNNEWLSTTISKFGSAMAIIKISRLLTKEITFCEDILYQRKFNQSIVRIEKHFASNIPRHPKGRKAKVAVVNAFQNLQLNNDANKPDLSSKEKPKNNIFSP